MCYSWLQVLYNGQWGTITASAQYWGLKEAIVVCRMLGLPTDDAQPLKYAFFGPGEGKIWLQQVRLAAG